LISHGLARTKDDNTEEDNIDFDSRKEAETDDDYIPLWPTESADTETQKQPERFDFTFTHDMDRRIHPSNYTTPDVDKLEEEFPHPSFPTWRDPEKDKHISTSKLYQRALADHDWEEAVNAVVPYSRFSKLQKDMSRDQTDIDSVAELVRALWGDSSPSTQYLFRLYRDLPAPGVAVLSQRTRGALLRLFAHPRDRRWVDARRYLALVDDMVAARLPVSRSLWSSAIHLAGRSNSKVSKRDLIRAVGLWQKMEHVAGVKADEVVFNILFDIAIKAGAFKVADRLEEEMAERGLGFSRCGKVSKIYYFGLMRDAEGIRIAFDDFIKSGEIVDTVVMNCLIASFLRAGETQTAEQLYSRMLEQQQSKNKHVLPSDDKSSFHIDGANLSYDMPQYRQRARKLGRVLKKSSALREKFPEYHRALQDSLSMTPDTRTFHIFLRHYAHSSGQLDSFMAVMRDMERTFVVPPRAIIYMFLFEGFALHGRRKKQWSAENLRLTWHAYIRALRDSSARLRGLYLNNRKMTWENPLAKSVAIDFVEELPVEDVPNGLYMPLPSVNIASKPEQSAEDIPEDILKSSTTTDPHRDDQNSQSQLDDEDESSDIDEIDADEVFGPSSDFPRSDFPSEAEQTPWDPEHRIENGLFIGRRMITTILQAFGTCCGPKEVLEVWLQLERMWHPQQRKAIDVLAVKEELDKQMARDPRRNR
jgi:pentatricopeptide repeat protein